LANAQLALDQDELDDAQQGLARAGGDERANLQRAHHHHQAVRQGALPLGKLSTAGLPATLREQIQEWFSLAAREDQVQAAREDADRKAGTLSQLRRAAPAARIGGHDARDSAGGGAGDQGTGRALGRQIDRRRLHQLRVITSIAIQVVAAMTILLVMFGAPSRMPTIVGLAGPGLTVVLKDFIVAFFGWFVPMGRNGIGLGDRVEINGVGGEAIEVGISAHRVARNAKLDQYRTFDRQAKPRRTPRWRSRIGSASRINTARVRAAAG
jgi:hypothetical protein